MFQKRERGAWKQHSLQCFLNFLHFGLLLISYLLELIFHLSALRLHLFKIENCCTASSQFLIVLRNQGLLSCLNRVFKSRDQVGRVFKWIGILTTNFLIQPLIDLWQLLLNEFAIVQNRLKHFDPISPFNLLQITQNKCRRVLSLAVVLTVIWALLW